MSDFLFILQSVAPVFMITFLGILLKHVRLIDDHFVNTASQLVFKVALPLLVFFKLADIDSSHLPEIRQLIFILLIQSAAFLLLWILAAGTIPGSENRGVFIQGGFRSNYAIFGFAVTANMFGEEALARAAVILAFIMPLYNILSVFILSHYSRKMRCLPPHRVILQVFTNPLILAALFSIPFSVFHISIPSVFSQTGHLLASLSLPLALIGIGGSLNLRSLHRVSMIGWYASLMKLVAVPLLSTIAAVFAGFRGVDLGILFILFGCPTAVVSFIMTKNLGGNSKMAGHIILMTTLGAAITIPLGLYVLRIQNWIP